MCPTPPSPTPASPAPADDGPPEGHAPNVGDLPAPIVRGLPVEVADGVHVIPDRRVELVPNIGLIEGRDSVLVVDTGMGPRNGAYVLDQARRLAGGRRLYLTTTHFHPEHAFGAQEFADAATIVCNRGQADELRRKGSAYLDMFRGLGPAVAAELDGVTFVEPHVTYDGETRIDLGGRTALLRAVGPAHTASDQIVLIDDQVLFGGDLFETRIFPITPYFPPHDTDVDPARWIRVLDRLAALEPAVVVPGHGEVSDVSVVRDVRDHLAYVRDEAERLRADGVPVEEAVAAIDGRARARWPSWERPEWIAYSARACYEKSAA